MSKIEVTEEEDASKKKRVDWKNFKPTLSTNKSRVTGLESARYGLDKPEYNINKTDVLYLIWCNSMKLLNTRGYVVNKEFQDLVYTEYTLDYAQKFSKWLKYFMSIVQLRDINLPSSLNNSFLKQMPNGTVDRIQMMYLDYSNPKTRTMAEVHFDELIIDNDKVFSTINRYQYSYRLMVISAGDWNSASRKLASNKEYPVELVKWDRLYSNPLENVMAVKYFPLSEDEKKKYFTTNRKSPSDCCMFTIDDPVVFWYGWPRDTLVRILRDDPYLTNMCDVRCEYRIVSPIVNPIRKL